MQPITKPRLNPLVAIAAVMLAVFSIVGIAALGGFVSSSRGQALEFQLPKDVVKPIAPAISHPVARPVARKPLAGQLAVVESVREVRDPGEAKGVGAVAGGVAGGVVGHKLGKGKTLGTVIGAAGGAFAGHQIEKHVRGKKHWETAVRLDDGSQHKVSSEVEPAWHAGDRVRLVDGRLQSV